MYLITAFLTLFNLFVRCLTTGEKKRSKEEQDKYYSSLATPVNRDYPDIISGMDSEVKNCTFQPFISKESRKLFSTLRSFDDGWREDVKAREEARNETPPLDQHCTFKPALSYTFRGSSKMRPAVETKEEWAARMSRYSNRSAQAGGDFTATARYAS